MCISFLIQKTNAIKIGYSQNVDRRIKQLQTSCDAELILLYTVMGSRETEGFYHRYFSMDRLNGEWFKADRIANWIKCDKIAREIRKQEGIV